MLKFLSNNEVASKFSKLKGERKIAVAFWGTGALTSLGLSGIGAKNVQIICNLESGATNPNVIDELRKSGANVKSNSRLHSKVYLAGNTVILGSSNASGNGLALEGTELTSWIEANILSDDKSVVADVTRWFRKQWKDAIDVTDDDIKHACKRWTERRYSRPYKQKADSFFDLPLDAFRDRPIHVAMYREYASAEAKKAFKKIENELKQKTRSSSAASKLSFFEEWNELPLNASIISVHVGPQGGVHLDVDVYRRVPELDPKGGTIQMVKCEKQILTWSFDKKMRDDLRERIAHKISEFQNSENDSCCIPLFDALKDATSED